MASIHKQSSHTTKKFSSTSSNDDSSRHRSSADDLWDFYLPVSRKGRFFQDSSFGQARDEFDSAIKDVLNKWGEPDLLKDAWDDSDLRHSDILSRYRKLRSHNLKEDSQAVKITSDNNCHKIVMDVHDFMDGEVKVKVVGERQLVVEGHMDATKARDFAPSSHTFTRRFSLPGATNMDAITSVMSLDGILTITAPQTTNQAKADDSTIPIKVTGTRSSEAESQSTTSQAASATEDKSESHNAAEKVRSGKTSTTAENKESTNKESEQREHVHGASTGRSASTSTQQTSTQHSTGKQTDTETRTQKPTPMSSTDFRDIPFSVRDFETIKRKGHFFDDSFFEDTRSDFQNAVNDVLRKWDTTDFLKEALDDTDVRLSNNLKRYRRLRSLDLNEDNQAVTVTSDNTCHKIVMDVHDFMDGEVKVKVVGERQLVVEGHMDATKARDFAPSSHTFTRRFSLPDATNIDAISSVMSSDGILTIIAPYIVNQAKEEYSTIPIKVTGTKARVSETHSSTSTSHPTADSFSSSASSNLTEATEEGCAKNEFKQNVTESVHLKEDKVVSTKDNTTDKVDGNMSQLKGSKESTDQFTYSQERSSNSASDITQVNSAIKKAEEESKKQDDEVTTASHVSSQTSVSSKISEERESINDSKRGVAIPIKTRGLFFNDCFFEDTWKDYQDAVKDVVVKWGDSSTCDDMTCYRKLRTRDLREENQAVKASEDDSNYKFILDVQDFLKGGDITVRVVDERDLVVEGHVEAEAGGARVFKHFRRRFVLPGDVALESVSSVMSSDGVLTIIAPKKHSKLSMKESAEAAAVKELAESVRESREQEVRVNTQANTQQSTEAKAHTDESSDSFISISSSSVARESSVDQTKEHAIPVQIKTQNQLEKSSEVKVEACERISENAQQKTSGAQETSVNFDNAATYKDAAEKNCSFREESDNDAVHPRLLQEGRAKFESDDDTEAESVTKTKEHVEIDPAYKNRLLPIKIRGLFSDDSFFLESRQNFKTAIKDVLKKYHEVPSQDDDGLSSYRNLRLKDLKLENQAAHVDDDRYTQMILLDVYDFLGGEVTAKVVDGLEVVVEGRAQRQAGTSLTTLSFLRRFPLPDRADLTAIMAVMSSDGVLLIIVPKLKKFPKVKALSKESSVERQSRTDSDVGRCLRERNVRDSSWESEGRSPRSFVSSRLRNSPEFSTFMKEMSTESQQSRASSHGEARRSWEDRNLQESSQDSEGVSSGFSSSVLHSHQHSSADQF
nr:uncharacterized protein LOC123756146 [Procambarus clarkii]